MSSSNTARQSSGNQYSCRVVQPSKHVPSLLEDAQDGLLKSQRSLPPKYFYDAYGSELFDRICDTKEYYPTRVETSLLRAHSAEIIRRIEPSHIVELGSGTSRKTRFLLEECESAACQPKYWPMDVCEPMLLDTAKTLTEDFPWLTVNALVGDYHGGFDNFPNIAGKILYVFLGGTIGNFEHGQAVELLGEMRELMNDTDYMLLGFDRVKDENILEAAYNDTDGVTAEFNRNLLRVLNRDLDADFSLEGFAHKAVYNADAAQIEMYLVSKDAQTIEIGELGQNLSIRKDERILTEISRKFTPDSIQKLLADGGFRMVHHFEAEQSYYSLILIQPC